MSICVHLLILTHVVTLCCALSSSALADEPAARKVQTGKEALGDWTSDAPGVRRKITTDDLVVTDDGDVWGRPVGAAIADDGALLVTDDASGTIWRVAYTGREDTSKTQASR